MAEHLPFHPISISDSTASSACYVPFSPYVRTTTILLVQQPSYSFFSIDSMTTVATYGRMAAVLYVKLAL